jgi:hypothetical protein
MSNNIILFITFIIVLSSVSPFEIEIIKNRANDNPFGFFGPPDNLITEIINDMEKNIEKSQSSFPIISNKSKNKLPHRHKEIIEVNGPGFKSVEIREILTPEDQNRTKESHGGIFGHFSPSPSKGSNENILEKVMEEFQKDMLDDKKHNPIEDIFGNLFAPPQHNPVIFLKQRKNLKHDNIFNTSQDQEDKKSGPPKLFPVLDNIIEELINSEISDSNHKDRPADSAKEHKEPPHINMIQKKEEEKKPKENKNDKLALNVVSKSKTTETHSTPHHEKENLPHNKNQTNIQSHPSIPKNYNSHPKIEVHKDTHPPTNIGYLKHLPSFLTFKNPIMQYVVYSLIFLIVILFVICLSYKIILRDSELNKGNLNHSINQIEDELKGMKEKNKLY